MRVNARKRRYKMRTKFSFLAVVIGVLVLSGRSSAQDLPPEAFVHYEPNHWAWQVVTDLQQQGILEGYPDGKFRGKRPVTRYELAFAIKRLWDKTEAFSEKEENSVASTLMAVFSPSEPVTDVGGLFKDMGYGW